MYLKQKLQTYFFVLLLVNSRISELLPKKKKKKKNYLPGFSLPTFLPGAEEQNAETRSAPTTSASITQAKQGHPLIVAQQPLALKNKKIIKKITLLHTLLSRQSWKVKVLQELLIFLSFFFNYYYYFKKETQPKSHSSLISQKMKFSYAFEVIPLNIIE